MTWIIHSVVVLHLCNTLIFSFDSTLQSVKSCAGGNEELSATFLEVRGHFYMCTRSLLLKMGQHSDVQWRAPRAGCALLSHSLPGSAPCLVCH